MEENQSFQIGKDFLSFFGVFIILHHLIPLDACRELKTDRRCLKKCLIYLHLAFFIFGLDWERGWILALENTSVPNSRFEESIKYL